MRIFDNHTHPTHHLNIYALFPPRPLVRGGGADPVSPNNKEHERSDVVKKLLRHERRSVKRSDRDGVKNETLFER